MKQIKTYQYKLKPTKEQEKKLEQWLGTCRYIYNLAFEYKQTLWRHYRISISKVELKKELVRIAREVDWIEQVNAQSRELVIDRLYLAFEKFFKKDGGYPKFAKKNKFNSIQFRKARNSLRICTKSCILTLPTFGRIRFYNSQPCENEIKTVSVKKLADGWHAFIVTEVEIEPLLKSDNRIGIDVGIKSLITTSTGEMVGNPNWLKKNEIKLKRLQRSVTRKKKGSNNRKKAIQKLAKQHQKVANARKDFQHKLTTRLIYENQTIVVENIRVENLLKNHNLAKSIGDAGWGQLVYMLAYKAQWYGRELIKVPAQNTSKTCSSCGLINSEVTLGVQEWVCPNCSTLHDRDINAAHNILTKAA